MQAALPFLFLFLLQATGKQAPQSPLGKSHIQVIAMLGEDYKKMTDGGHQVLQYKKSITNNPKTGSYTTSEFVYFEQDTCIKDVLILPANQEGSYVDSFNLQYKPTGFHSWMGPDGSFISISLRDGLLDISSFSAAYYKQLSGH